MRKFYTIGVLFLLLFLLFARNHLFCESDIIFLPIEEQLLKNKEKISQGFEPINFKFVQIGKSKSKTIYINNSGSNPFRIQSVVFQLGGVGVFSFSTNPAPPIIIGPDESIFINLGFTPSNVNRFYDTLLITFDEPFEFVYALPVEGASFSINQIFIQDTSALIGTKDFQMPIFIKGDSNIEEPVMANLVFSLTFNSSLFSLLGLEQGTIIGKQQNGLFTTYDLVFDNIPIDSTTKVLTKIKGLVLLGYPDTTTFEIKDARSDTAGILFDLHNGLFQSIGVCISKTSLVELQDGITDLHVYPVPANGTLNIEFINYNLKPNETAEIVFCNILGQLLERTTFELHSNVQTISLDKLTSGVYRLYLFYKGQAFSTLFSVVK
jgi:hypothetical protein